MREPHEPQVRLSDCLDTRTHDWRWWRGRYIVCPSCDAQLSADTFIPTGSHYRCPGEPQEKA